MRKIFKKILVLLFIVAFCMPLFACGENELAKVSAKLSSYEIDIDYDHEQKSMQIKQKTNYANNSDAILNKIYFHLYVTAFKEGAMNVPVGPLNEKKAYYNGKNYGSIVINKVFVNGSEIQPEYSGNDNDILIVELKSRLLPTERVDINFEYTVTIPNMKHRFGYGENTVNIANFYPIACVYENGGWCTEPYHHNGDPFYSDMANYKVKIKYDQKLVLASTGEQSIAIKQNSNVATMTAKCVRDFAMVLSEKFSVAKTKYKNTEIKYYYFDDEIYNDNLNCALQAIKTFSKLFKEYPYSTFSVVKADFLHGGMEYPMLVYISADVDNESDYYNVIIHETAHQWWYNLVGNNEFKDPWLDESITEFSTLLFYDYNKGYDFTRAEMIDATYSNYLFFLTIYKDILGEVDTSMNRALDEYDTEPEYTYMAYVKGVLMYDSLCQIIGKNRFISSLKLYAKEFSYKNATPQDLINCFEKASGVALQGFFESWIEGKVIIN